MYHIYVFLGLSCVHSCMFPTYLHSHLDMFGKESCIMIFMIHLSPELMDTLHPSHPARGPECREIGLCTVTFLFMHRAW